jgi:hypothetical protein
MLSCRQVSVDPRMVPEAGSARARAKIRYGIGEMTAHCSWA